MQSERLKQIRNKLGLSQAKFGSMLKIPQTTYANYESGKALIPDNLKSELMRLGINLNWLITGEGSMYLDGRETGKTIELGEEGRESGMDPYKAGRDVPGIDKDVYLLPVTNILLSAGHGENWLSGEEYIDTAMPVPRKLASRYGDLIAAIVRGDSMYPTIKNGEPVAIAKDTLFDGDGIYAISRHNELYIKRLARLGNSMKIISDNPKYPIETIDPGSEIEEFSIIGKVVFWIHVE